jgi:hypothetical protein
MVGLGLAESNIGYTILLFFVTSIVIAGRTI